MLTTAEIYTRKKEASGQVSTQTRSLALGFLAISWALLTAHDEPLRSMAANANRYLILALASISVLVIICDLLQYVAITAMAEAAFKRSEASAAKQGQFDAASFAYRAQERLYHAKFSFLGIGSILLLIVFWALFQPIKPASSVSNPIPACTPGCCPAPLDVRIPPQAGPLPQKQSQ